MTGLRQGELIALRWGDVDWTAGVIRVRRSFSRREMTTPKSQRSIRAVPMADSLAAALDLHFKQPRSRPRAMPFTTMISRQRTSVQFPPNRTRESLTR